MTCLAGSITYDYDELGRLKTTTYDNGGVVNYGLDKAGNRLSVSTTGVPDTIPPGQPGALSFSAVAGTTATATWTAATDNIGVAGYDYSLNGGSSWVQLGNVLTVNLTGLTGSTNYTMSLRARDGAGLTGPLRTGTFTTGDATPPSQPGTITPSNVLSGSATMTWLAATDNVGVTGYDYRLSTVSTTGNWVSLTNVLTVNLTGLIANTNYTFDVRAHDALGNIGALRSVAFQTPSATDTTKPSAPPSLGFGSITATSASASWGTSTDNVAVTGYEYRIYRTVDTPPATFNLVSGGAGGTSVPLSGLITATAYRFDVEAFDAAGNRSTISTGTFTTLDNSAPSAPGTPSISNIVGTTATASWGVATDNVGVTGYEYRVYPTANGPPATWTSVGATTTASLSGLAIATNHTFEVRAFDAAGNRGPASSITFFSTDNQAPGAPGTPGFSSIGGNSATASWGAATDNQTVAGYEYRLWVGSTLIADWTNVGATTSTGLGGLVSATTYTFDVRAYDGVGNRGGSSSGSFTTADNVAPGPPGVPVFTGVTATSATATWGGASDNVGVSGYEYRVYPTSQSAPAWSAVGGTSVGLAGLVGGVPYRFEVRAYDGVGLRGAASTSTFSTTNPVTSSFTGSFTGTGGTWTVQGFFGFNGDGTLTAGCAQACNVTSSPARWLAAGSNAADYETLTVNSGCGSEVQATYGVWTNQFSWNLLLNDPQGQQLFINCSVTISIRAKVNPSATLGTGTVSYVVWTGT